MKLSKTVTPIKPLSIALKEKKRVTGLQKGLHFFKYLYNLFKVCNPCNPFSRLACDSKKKIEMVLKKRVTKQIFKGKSTTADLKKCNPFGVTKRVTVSGGV